MSTRENLENKIFGDILVLEYDTQINTHAQWKCLCMLCNQLTYVSAINLKSGNTKSCPSCGQKKTNYIQECEIINRLRKGEKITHIAKDLGLCRSIIYRVERKRNNLFQKGR